MRFTILIALLFLSCAATREVLIPTPPMIEVRYLPAETSAIVDSQSTIISMVHDTVVKATTRWRETTKEVRVIDTIPKYIIHCDTVIVDKPIPTPKWKFYWIIVCSFLGGVAASLGLFKLSK